MYADRSGRLAAGGRSWRLMVGPGAMHRPAHVNHGNTADGGQRRARRSSLARTASRAQPRGPLSAGRTTSLSAARASPSAPEQPPHSPHHLPQRARAPQRSPHRPSSARPSTPAQPAPPLLSTPEHPSAARTAPPQRADVEPTCVSREVKHTCAQHRRVVGVSRSVSALPACPPPASAWPPPPRRSRRRVLLVAYQSRSEPGRSGRSGMGSGPLGAAHRGPPGGRERHRMTGCWDDRWPAGPCVA